MAHPIKLTAYVYRYAAFASAVKAETPMYSLFTYKTPSVDWTFVKEIEIVDVDEYTADERIQQAVATIDKAILEKRMELENDVKELMDRKNDLLSLTFEA
jgi:hypothetical protein